MIIISWFAISIAAQSDIQKVDFKNFSYNLSCGSADAVSRLAVRNGQYKGLKNGERVYLKVYEVLYGDLNKDGKNEAVVLYSCGSGASYVYFRGLVFSMRNDRPKYLTSLEGGNKGDGGFYKVRIRKQLILAERYQLANAGSPCCPESIETTKYRLIGARLKTVGSSSSRPIPNMTTR